MKKINISILAFTFAAVVSGIVLSFASTDAQVENGQVEREDTRVMAPSEESPEVPQDISNLPIPQAAEATGAFMILTETLKQTGLDETLSQEGPYTIFAPLDGAFVKLPQETIDDMQNDTNMIADVLRFHVVEGRISSDQLVITDSLTTIDGRTLNIKQDQGGLKVNDATILTRDVETSNGLIHAIDTVLFP